MRTTIKIVLALAAVALVSCNSKRSRNYQYFPNMYESVGYEAYSSHDGNIVFDNNNTSEALKPVEGSVHRGWLPYDYDNSNKGYQTAKAELKNPISYTKENKAKGMQLYTIYCAICHGDKGNGKGHLVKTEKILGVPSYDDIGRAITQGSIYHVMYYGINSMGSYASQTSIEERWQIVQYVESLKAALEGKPERLDAVDKYSAKQKSELIENVDLAGDVIHAENDLDLTKNEGEYKINTNLKDSIKKKTSYSKKSLLQGKSHHSHKELGKK